jgi:hypothetical protein
MPFTKAIKFLYSKSLFNMLFLNELGPLGRWNKETCAIKLNKKIDLANEDNCGPCGEYILTKLDLTKTKTKTNKTKSASPYLIAEHEEQEQSKY